MMAPAARRSARGSRPRRCHRYKTPQHRAGIWDPDPPLAQGNVEQVAAHVFRPPQAGDAGGVDAFGKVKGTRNQIGIQGIAVNG